MEEEGKKSIFKGPTLCPLKRPQDLIFIFLRSTAPTTYSFISRSPCKLFLPKTPYTSSINILLTALHHHPHNKFNMSTTQIQNGSSHGSSSSSSQQVQQPPSNQQPLSRYESQKKRDWNTFGQYLKNQSPPVPLSQCNFNHVLDFLRYLDQFGKTKVHLHGCIFFGQPSPPAPCVCPLRQAWGSLDALIGRLRAAYEEHGGSPETNPFGGASIRVYLREVKECQAKARGIPYKKKKKKRNTIKGIQSAKDIDQQTS